MKRYTLIVLFCLFTAALTATGTKTFYAGPVLGGTLASIAGSGSDTSMKFGIAAGIMGEYYFSPGFSLESGCIYIHKGTKEKSQNFSYGFWGEVDDLSPDIIGLNRTLHLAYFEIPMLFKLHFYNEGDFEPVLFAGFAASILQAASVKYDDLNEEVDYDDGYITDASLSINVADELSGTEIGAVVGTGFDIKSPDGGKYVVKLMYEMGITSVDPGSGGRNSVFTLIGGYYF